MDVAASVIVRAKDKAPTIGATLRALRAQTVPVEIVVVDSGSTDGTLEIARQHADTVIEIATADFSYGGALNLGAEAASAEVHLALSAHCVPAYDHWVESSVAHYARGDVAGTNQASHTPYGVEIDGTYHQRLEDARRFPYWGFSNHASSWRASVWREHPFREDLQACEDKEWSWRVLAAGWTIAYDPRLNVPSVHRRKAGVVELWKRHRKESEALAQLGALPHPSYREWPARWRDLPRSTTSPYPHLVRLFSPYRMAAVHADIAGARTAQRLPGPGHPELTGAPQP